ncbi:glycosyltransferase family 2 protein [Candidatus Woesearchaeota archaeon]|nr:glycosyltransferase family 2 protein [Candidatus Woesearchaeota archaeon]
MLSGKKIAVIIVNYNGKKYLKECLDSLRIQTYKYYGIILVDNGSVDGSVNFIKKYYPEVILMLNKKNEGFSKANNVALKYCLNNGFDYFVLLNQDTVVQSNFLSEGINMLNNYADICCPKILYYDSKKIWYAGSPVFDNFSDFLKKNILSVIVDKNVGKDDGPEFNEKKEVGFASGCAFFLRKDILENIGFLDENFFFNWETRDYSKRARDKGYRVMYFPETVVLHNTKPIKDSKEVIKKFFFSKTGYWMVSGLLKYMKKHFGLSRTVLYVLKAPIEIPLTLFVYLKKIKKR